MGNKDSNFYEGDIVKRNLNSASGGSSGGGGGDGVISHWGVYVGNCEVISLLDDGYLHKESAYGYQLCYHVTEKYRLKVAKVARALFRKGGHDYNNKMSKYRYGYCILYGNCQHFAEFCQHFATHMAGCWVRKFGHEMFRPVKTIVGSFKFLDNHKELTDVSFD